MSELYLSLGTNLGDRQENLLKAIREIGLRIGTVTAVSSVLETQAWGFRSENSFLNQVVRVETAKSPADILDITQMVEKEMGRKEKSRDGRYADRIIDIDLLLYDRTVISTGRLTLPHPLMHKRHFVLDPLAELAPDLVHPVLGKTIRQLADELE